MNEIIFATTSSWKIEQASKFLTDFPIDIIHPPGFDEFEDDLFTSKPGGDDTYAVEIQSDDFREVAEYKSHTACQRLGEPVIVEDTGVRIDALNGFPGPYSKYVLLTIGLEGLLKLMEDVENRRVRYLSVVSYCSPNDGPIVFEGVQTGTLTTTPKRDPDNPWKDALLNPIFVPDEVSEKRKTLGEMDPHEITSLESYPQKTSIKKFAKWFDKHINE